MLYIYNTQLSYFLLFFSAKGRRIECWKENKEKRNHCETTRGPYTVN